MSKVKTNSQYYTDIASAIRYKNEGANVYYPSDMAQAILDIPTGGGGSEELKDIFNHGSVIGLNPLYAQYNQTYDNYIGILNSSPNYEGLDRSSFSIENNEYMLKTFYGNDSWVADGGAYSIFCCPFTSAHYRKIKADCEVINGREDRYNGSAIGAMDIRNLYDDFYDSTTRQSYLQRLRNTLTSGGPSYRFETVLTDGYYQIYNKERTIVQADITGEDRWLCVYLRAKRCQLKVYSIWLEE